MNQPIEYVSYKISIKRAMAEIDEADKRGDYAQAQQLALELVTNGRLLYQAYGSWTTDHAETPA
jgi:hypothetical protein